MRCNSDYVEELDHDFSHLPREDVELLYRRGAVVAEFYASSLIRDKEGTAEIVRLYKYTPLIGTVLFETVRNNRIVLEDPRLAQAA